MPAVTSGGTPAGQRRGPQAVPVVAPGTVVGLLACVHAPVTRQVGLGGGGEVTQLASEGLLTWSVMNTHVSHVKHQKHACIAHRYKYSKGKVEMMS